MDLTIITEYISPIILIACLIVGYVIKHAIPNETINRYIPLILAVLGGVLNVWACMGVDLEIVVTGMMSGLASVGLYELFAQFIEKGFTDSAPTEEKTEE